MATNQNAPVKKFTIGHLTASVWKNETADRDFYSVELQRRYRDSEGEWQNSSSLGHADLLVAAHLLQRAEEFIYAQQ